MRRTSHNRIVRNSKPSPAFARNARLRRSGALSVCLALLLLALCHSPSLGQSQADEYRVKAAFLYHFAQLIEWPSDPPGDPKSAFLVCTLGADPFHGDLENTIGGKSIGKRTIQIKHFKQPQEASDCEILFIARTENQRLRAILGALADAPILSVGEADDFVQQGGTIGFFLEDSKIRFDINLGAANHSGLQISSRLLLLAKNVIGKGGGD
ncbi:MAG TPA: YfiR family protein [Candidatus Acidoferrales bacterium]|nr:YfiR family protein [Candidatus Acidoferrales bacterium]